MQGKLRELQGAAQGGEQQALTHRAAALEMVRLGQENALLVQRLQEVQLDAQVAPHPLLCMLCMVRTMAQHVCDTWRQDLENSTARSED